MGGEAAHCYFECIGLLRFSALPPRYVSTPFLPIKDPPASFDLKAQLVAYFIGLATSNPTTGAIVAVILYVLSALTLLVVPLIWPGSVLSLTRRTINDTRDWLEDLARRRANGAMYRICASGHFALDEIHERVHDLESLHRRRLRPLHIFKYALGAYSLSRAAHACMREADTLRINLENQVRGLRSSSSTPPSVAT
ncbi:hypothetical protein CPB85DRAFT_749914 [Mucidula mucida]|nr:hypothetical protein CPB85DRAFT_749914 [Mucidula mucida]